MEVVEFAVAEGESARPKELAVFRGATFVRVQLSARIHDNAIYRIEDGSAELAKLEDGSPFRADHMVPQLDTPFVYVRSGDDRGYYVVRGNKANPIAFDRPLELGQFDQRFLSPRLFWDGTAHTLYRVSGGTATAIQTDAFSKSKRVAAAEVGDESLVLADGVKWRLYRLDAEGKVDALELRGIEAAATASLVATKERAYIFAAGHDELYEFVGGDIAFVGIGEDERLRLGSWRACAATSDSFYFTASRGDGPDVLWRREDSGDIRMVTDEEGSPVEDVELCLATAGDEAAGIFKSKHDHWVVRGISAVRIEDSSGILDDAQDFGVSPEHCWIHVTDDARRHTVYVTGDDGKPAVAQLPDGADAVADGSAQRTPTGAGIFEGMELKGRGSSLFLYRWTREGRGLYRLK